MSPPPEEPPPKVMGLLVWALVVFSALCVAAGAAVALLVPRLV